MRIRVEDTFSSTMPCYPPSLMRFTLLDGYLYHGKLDLRFGFREDRTFEVRLIGNDGLSRNRRTFASVVKQLFHPIQPEPPAELFSLTSKLFGSNVIDFNGLLDGAFLPITFTSSNVMEVTKLDDVGHRDAERAILSVIGCHFRRQVEAFDARYKPLG